MSAWLKPQRAPEKPSPSPHSTCVFCWGSAARPPFPGRSTSKSCWWWPSPRRQPKNCAGVFAATFMNCASPVCVTPPTTRSMPACWRKSTILNRQQTSCCWPNARWTMPRCLPSTVSASACLASTRLSRGCCSNSSWLKTNLSCVIRPAPISGAATATRWTAKSRRWSLSPGKGRRTCWNRSTAICKVKRRS